MRIGSDVYIEFWQTNPITGVDEPKLGSDRICPLDGRLSLASAREKAEAKRPAWASGYRIVRGISNPRELSKYWRW